MGPNEAAERWRAASEADRPGAFSDLTNAVRTLAFTVLLAQRVPSAEAEDRAQDLAVRIPPRITAGQVAPGSETSFTSTCARNAAISYFRTARRLVPFPEEEEPVAPEAAADEDIAARENLELLARIIREARTARHEILTQRYVDGLTIEELVNRELERESPGTVTEELRKRVRARIDNRLRLARNWVCKRVEQLGGVPRTPKGPKRKGPKRS